QIYADGQRQVKSTLPLSGLPACFVEYPFADLNDKARFLCDMNELVRLDQPVQRMAPPYKGFEFISFPGREIDYRLIKDLEFVAFDGVAKIGFDLQQVHILNVHLAVEYLVSCLAGFFCAVHGGVSVTQEIL